MHSNVANAQDRVLDWEVFSTRFPAQDRPEGALRARVPGGWFVFFGTMPGMSPFFYPDPEHGWDGTEVVPPSESESPTHTKKRSK